MSKSVREMEDMLKAVEKRIAQKRKAMDTADVFSRPRYVMQHDALVKEAHMLRKDIESQRAYDKRQEERDNMRHIFFHDK